MDLPEGKVPYHNPKRERGILCPSLTLRVWMKAKGRYERDVGNLSPVSGWYGNISSARLKDCFSFLIDLPPSLKFHPCQI